MVLAKLVRNSEGKEQEIQVDWCVSFTYPGWNIIVNTIMLFHCHFQALKWRTASVGEANSIHGETVKREASNVLSWRIIPHAFLSQLLSASPLCQRLPVCGIVYLFGNLMDFILAPAYCLFLFKMATALSLCHNFRCVLSQWISAHSGQVMCTFWLADRIKKSGSSVNTEAH